MGGKTDHAEQCPKSRALTQLINLITAIEYFEQQCVIIKGLLHSDRLKQHITTI